MKFSCTKENILNALGVLGHITGKHVNLPILQNVLIQVSGGGVSLIATNLEIAVKIAVRAKVEHEGEFTVPARVLLEYLSAVPGERLDVELKEDALHLTLGTSTTTIKGMNAGEYPLIPPVESGIMYKTKSSDLQRALRTTIFAASKSDVRPELAGVFFQCGANGNDTLTLAATDSYRLAEHKVALLPNEAGERAVIVPGRAAAELERILLLEEETSEVSLTIGSNQILFTTPSTELTSRIIEGNYPNYRHIIPEDTKTHATVSTDELIRQVKAASLFTGLGVGAVTLTIDQKEGGLTVASTSTQLGEHKGTIDAEVEGAPQTALLNYRYLLDGLQAMGSEKTTIKVSSPDTPCLFVPHGTSGYVYMVMPIKQ